MADSKNEGIIVKYSPSIKEVRELVRITGAGIFDCHSILIKANGNITKAIEMIRTLHQAIVIKKEKE